jgi:hypothetical protein
MPTISDAVKTIMLEQAVHYGYVDIALALVKKGIRSAQFESQYEAPFDYKHHALALHQFNINQYPELTLAFVRDGRNPALEDANGKSALKKANPELAQNMQAAWMEVQARFKAHRESKIIPSGDPLTEKERNFLMEEEEDDSLTEEDAAAIVVDDKDEENVSPSASTDSPDTTISCGSFTSQPELPLSKDALLWPSHRFNVTPPHVKTPIDSTGSIQVLQSR